MYKRRYVKTTGQASRRPTALRTRNPRKATSAEVLVDTKYFDSQTLMLCTTKVPTINPTTTGATYSIVSIPQGNSANDREGRSCVITGISVNVLQELLPMTTKATADGTPASITRWLLIQDRQCNGAFPAATDVFTASCKTVTFYGDNVNSQLNLDNEERFKVLMDHTYVVNPTYSISNVAAQTTGPMWIMKKYHVNCNIKIDYNASSLLGVITSITSNNLFIASMGNQGWMVAPVASRLDNSATAVNINANVRVEFIG